MHRIALADGGVDLGFVRFHRGHGRIRFLRDDAVVGGHVPIVERLGVEPVIQRPAHAEVLHRLRKDCRCLLSVLFLEVLGIGAVVGDGFVLITQILRDLLSLRGSEAEALAHVGKQHGQVVGKRRVLLLFRYGRFKVQVASVELFLKGFQRMPLEQMLLTGKQLLSRQILEGEFSGIRITACKQLVELSGDVVGDGFVAFHHKPQRRGLHASDGEQAVETLGGESRLVHAEAHIRHLSGIGGVPGTTAGVVGHELVECLHDVLLDVVVHVDALDLTGVAEVVQKLVHDKLPLIVRVTGGDDGIASFKESRNLVYEGLLALSGLLIDRRFLRPVVNLDREYIKAPRHSPFWVDGIRFYQFQKVAGAGTDRVAVSRDGKAGAFGHLFSRDGAGDIAGEHRLFRDD